MNALPLLLPLFASSMNPIQLIIQVIVSAVLAAALALALITAITSSSLWVVTTILGVLALGLIIIAWLKLR
jgi:hypothetical protein